MYWGFVNVGLYISELFMLCVIGLDMLFGLSWCLNGLYGEFNGIVVGMLCLNYFCWLFDGINLGLYVIVMLICMDGMLFMW